MKQEFIIHAPATHRNEQKILAVRIGERHFGFAITGVDTGELLSLAWYTHEGMNERSLTELYVRHQELLAPFSRTLVAFDHPQSLLIPIEHFNDTEVPRLLETIHGVDRSAIVATDDVAGWQIRNSYAVPAKIRRWTERQFPNANFLHGYTVAIRNLDGGDENGSINADFRGNDFTVGISRHNKLLHLQTFEYANAADVLYYLLKSCEEFSLSQETVQLRISGLIDQQSALYRELYQYFRHISFREPRWKIADDTSNTYPSHFFISLNDLLTCG